jgi:NAD(P)-dependent dehydrogenase (short-subunit alcohol dehydrogenase family)
MSKLNEKVAVITGGNSGIGLATAKLFKSEGASVVITARTKESFETANKEYGTQFDIVKADVTDPAELDRLYAHIKSRYKQIDILFANAGVAKFLPTEQVDLTFFDWHFNTNVKGLYFTVAKALPLLKDGGRIILNASTVSYKGLPGASVYAATKAAVRSLARTWAAELVARKIAVNVLSPGPVETPIFGKMDLTQAEANGLADQIQSSVPMKRFASADEIARVALFLGSEDSSYLTGADVVADGGFSQV